MTQEQLISCWALGRALGHEWACTLELEQALALESPEAIRKEIEKIDCPHGVKAPAEDGGHRLPTRGYYAVNERGYTTIVVTRPAPTGESVDALLFEYEPCEIWGIHFSQGSQGSRPWEVCRSWHLSFLADAIKHLCPKASEEARAKASLLEEEEGPTRKEEDRVAFTREAINLAIERHIAAQKDLAEAETRAWQRAQQEAPIILPLPPMAAPTPAWEKGKEN